MHCHGALSRSAGVCTPAHAAKTDEKWRGKDVVAIVVCLVLFTQQAWGALIFDLLVR